jgi:hypothetical protein
MSGLAPFQARLLSGAHASITSTRRPDHDRLDDEALGRSWSRNDFAVLGSIRDEPWNPGDGPLTTISRLAKQMREQRGLLPAVIFSPAEVLGRLLQWSGTSLSAASDEGLVDSWIGMCWAAEAAWRAVTGEPACTVAYTTGDAALWRPVAARTRFLVLSEPMRWRAEPQGSWWRPEADQVFGVNGVLDRALGPESWNELAGRCREARREWQDCLDSYQSHPLLSQVKPGELEQELRTLVFRDGHTEPLGVSVQPLSERAQLNAEDTALIADVVERHLLPRFALLAVARLALHDGRTWQVTRVAVAVCVLLTGLGSMACAAALLIYPAVWLSAACYVLICGGVLVLPSGWGSMWLLRMPAASTVGVIALVSLLAGGWPGQPPGGWLAAGTLTTAAVGYLLIEVRNHGAAPWAALRRALGVAVIGAAHAAMVSLIGLVAIAPAFASLTGQLGDLWKHPGYGHACLLLALAAAWCLAVGVFSQILWEDRPITAALAHLSWRRGG